MSATVVESGEVSTPVTTTSPAAVSSSSTSTSDVVNRAYDLVEQLFSLRDRFHIEHEFSQDKQAAVTAMQADVLQQLNQMEFSNKEKAFFYLYKGRVLNVLNDYDADCEENLSRAIKLNPKLADAWCELGECHWKKGDVTKAYEAFRSALDYKTDKRALRNLSMVLRSLPSKSAEERAENIKKSVSTAKEALQLDVSDGQSWANLANAFMSVFFMGSRRHAIGDRASYMAKALSAFEQAYKDPIAKGDPFLHLNWGIALHYEDDYSRALSAFQLANQLDPAWDRPKEKIQELKDFLLRCNDLIVNRGHIKAKRFRSQIKQLIQNEIKELGPYAAGQYVKKSDNLPQSAVTLDFVTFDQLEVGSNIGKVILGSVVAVIGTATNTSFTVLLVDKKENFMPMSLFCIGAGMGPIPGDNISVPDPFVEHVHVNLQLNSDKVSVDGGRVVVVDDKEKKEKLVEFRLIRLPSTEVLVVNGRRINNKWAAQPVLCNTFVA